MFFIAYDDGGGFYDHVVPPMEDVPNPESPCQIMDGCHKYAAPHAGSGSGSGSYLDCRHWFI